jgi:hypothetical protein
VKGTLSFLANLLLFLSISTLLFSVAAYAAFKIKAKRKPKPVDPNRVKAGEAETPALLQQYVQPEPIPKSTLRPSVYGHGMNEKKSRASSTQKPSQRAP